MHSILNALVLRAQAEVHTCSSQDAFTAVAFTASASRRDTQSASLVVLLTALQFVPFEELFESGQLEVLIISSTTAGGLVVALLSSHWGY
jgi:hypothetical protein